MWEDETYTWTDCMSCTVTTSGTADDYVVCNSTAIITLTWWDTADDATDDPHWYLSRVPSQAAELKAHSAKARIRAARLLLQNLTREQRESLRRFGFFVVIGGKSGQRYRIRKGDGLVANIDVLAANDNVSHKLCAHCDLKAVPLGDHLLAQKIMLECAEDEFLQLANRHAA